MGARTFALIAGVAYVLIGIMGFIPSFVSAPHADHPVLAVESGYGLLLGLFPINLLHNIVHLAIGLWGLASYRSFSGARAFSRGLAVFYGLLAVMGIIPILNTTLGLIPIFGHDVWLHAITALAAAYFGFVGADERDYAASTTSSGVRTYNDNDGR
ncbi:MAG: hypothetical protein RLZZ387_3349 [Chloroflexota bacterium]